MALEWMTPLQASEKWEITERQAQSLCRQGKVQDAVKVSKVWLIPIDTPKPIDGRTKTARQAKANCSRKDL